jgi:hypothetical protein
MSDEREPIEIERPNIAHPSHHDSEQRTEGAGPSPEPGGTLLEIFIDRDLAVQLVGSDAGKARRMRPHGAMTKGSSDEELADVRIVMEPFLNDEIRRVHEDKTHRPKSFPARATPSQAASLKAFCLRFAASLEMNLEKHPGEDNRHRSQQRLDQARRVIDQVNAALGKSFDDGRTLTQCEREVVEQVLGLGNAIEGLKARALVTAAESSIAPLLELHDAVTRCLRNYGRT